MTASAFLPTATSTSRSPIRLGIIGINGRMGREILALASVDPAITIAGGTVRPGSAVNTPSDAVPITHELATLLAAVDVLIDFSTPESSVATAHLAADAGTPLVIGTTGLTDEDLGMLRDASARTAIYYARNTAHGVNALLRLLPAITRALTGYDIEIVEMHHRHKKDAPSGTALALAEAIESVLGNAGNPLIFGRDGYAPRQTGEIGVHSIRGGGNTGEHTIIFASDGEEIRISHRALNRGAFAAGAIRAACDLVGKAPGWYGPTS